MSVGKKSQDSAHFKRQHKQQTATALERFAPLLHVWPVCNENQIFAFRFATDSLLSWMLA